MNLSRRTICTFTAAVAALAAGLVVDLGHASPSTAATTTVDAFPVPGGHVASPASQISFRGVPASQLGSITVTGSKSGAHSGHIVGDSDGDGASFFPDKRFTAGETVTVATRLPIAGGHNGSYSFTVATPAGPIRAGAPLSAPRVRGDVERFASAPQLFPARMTVTRLPNRSEPGDLFVAPQAGPVQRGPEILGPYGELVWFKSVPKGDTATDFRVQGYHGAPVLTWWQGSINGGVGTGQDEIYDDHYRPVATVKAGNGLRADLHEFQLTPQNTALVTAYYPVYWNTSAAKGGTRKMLVLDSVVQEIDIPTGNVLFEWDSLDHVPVTVSKQFIPPNHGHPWDYFHVNSAQQASDGSIVISARNTWSVYDVSHATAATNWILGGEASSFRMGPGTQFEFQHDARLTGNQMTIFDDGAGPPVEEKQSRALRITVDVAHHRASLAHADTHSPGLLAAYEGSVQPQANGDTIVGWGQQPFVTEFNSRGRTTFDARFVGANSSYRAFRFAWTGTPSTLPSAAARVKHGVTTVWMSWNGATTVARWQLLAGDSPTALKPVGSARRSAFETGVRLTHGARYVAAQALDRHGHVLGTSKPVKG